MTMESPSQTSLGQPSKDVPGDGTPPVRKPARPSGPLLVWLLVQIGALGIAAGRIPLAARYPETGERLALDLLLGFQVGFSSLLFTWLTRDLNSTVMCIVSCWPMLALAVMLSALPPTALPVTGGFVTLWFATLAIWRMAFRTDSARAIATSIAASWVIGGPVLWYLRGEFNSQSEVFPAPLYGPLTGALAQIQSAGFRAADWMILGLLLIAGGITAALRRNRNAR